MKPSELLELLRSRADGGATDRLVSLGLEHALDEPLSQWLEPSKVSRAIRDALAAWAASASPEAPIQGALEAWRAELASDARTLREVLPVEVQDGLSALVRRPFSPDRQLVLALLDREPIRELVRTLLVDALLEFGKQLRAPVAGMTRGLTGLARMAAETAKSATGSFGAFAGGVVGAVSGEVERQFEKRARDFVDATLSTVIRRIAEQLSDPRRAAEQGALRAELLEGVLGLSLSQLSREAAKGDASVNLALIREAVERWLARADSEAELTALVKRRMEAMSASTARAVLSQLGVLDVFVLHARDFGRAQLGDFFDSPPFSQWVDSLFAKG